MRSKSVWQHEGKAPYWPDKSLHEKPSFPNSEFRKDDLSNIFLVGKIIFPMIFGKMIFPISEHGKDDISYNFFLGKIIFPMCLGKMIILNIFLQERSYFWCISERWYFRISAWERWYFQYFFCWKDHISCGFWKDDIS